MNKLRMTGIRERKRTVRGYDAAYEAKTRIYFFVKGTERVKPADLRKLLPKVRAFAGVPADAKAQWSQRAGCSCGCLPGFILDKDVAKRDVFVDVEVQS